MEFTKTGEFKVGNTTLSTPIQITIPVYGYELPEIHSSSPIPIPIYTKVANIINWLERGITVEFCERESVEKVFFFIMEYNRYVQEENKKIDDIENHYRLALKAQEKLYRTIDFKNYIENKRATEEIPFKKNIFKGIKKKSTDSFTNPFYKRNKREPSKSQKDHYEDSITPGDVYAFDIFAPIQDIIVEKTRFDEVELD
jgi:hypothetical protein